MTTKFIKVFSILAMMSISLLLFGIANGAGCNYKVEGIDEQNGRAYKGSCQQGILTYYALDKYERRLTKGLQISFMNSIVIFKFYQDTMPLMNKPHHLSMPRTNILQQFRVSDLHVLMNGRRVMVFTSSFPERKLLKVKINGHLSFSDRLNIA
ncbi:hypothetical protein [Aeromonas veronii]|uniref:hypothetical protein n=1 Tax=Aeromonas veronii TaxID=654 RepID=UPI0032EB96A0